MKRINLILLFSAVFIYSDFFSIVETTFKDKDKIFDNNIKTYSVSESLNSSEQYIIINLKQMRYLKSLTLYWNEKFCPKNYSILGSNDYINWFTIKRNIDATAFKLTDGIYINNIDINNRVSQFVKIYIQQDSRVVSNKYKILKIGEIKFEFSENVVPKILFTKVKNIDKHSAEIEWKSDYEILGQVRYGLSPDKVENIQTEFFFKKEHNIKLVNLAEGKEYFYQIISSTPDNKFYTSELKSFKTAGIPLPEIVSVDYIEKSYNYAKLKIVSNIETELKFEYKNGIIEDKKYKRIHILEIKGLEPLKSYDYKVEIKDNRENINVKRDKFSTGEYNIALNKPVEGTFRNHFIADVFTLKGNIISRVNDASFDYKNGMAVSFDPKDSEQFVILDLGKASALSEIITYWRALAYPYFYYILYSNDKKKWEQYDGIVNLKSEPIKRIEGSGIPMKIGDTEVKNLTTRYIKLFIPKGTPYYKKYPQYKFLQLLEVKVYGVYIK